MAEVGWSLARRLNEQGFKPGALIKHKDTGEQITVERILKGKVYRDNLGTGRAGWVQSYEVVAPNYSPRQDYWGKVDNCRRPSSRWF
ncbi:MAG: hypothetical protein RLZZ283_721 [Candidatus Parcubacteria bacterium]|jgi:hypothetical protein